MFLQLRQFWTDIQIKLAKKNLSDDSIGGIRRQLAKLQKSDKKVWKFKASKKLQERWENINKVLYYQSLFFVFECKTVNLVQTH